MSTSLSNSYDKYIEFGGFGKTHRSLGGGPWSYVADVISHDLPSFGDAIDSIYVTIFCNGTLSKDDRGFPPLNDTETVKFYRKKKSLEIDYPSQYFTPDEGFLINLDEITREHFLPAFDDLLQALRWGLKKRITSKDDFDVDGFIAWIEHKRSLKFNSEKGLQEAIRAAWSKRDDRNAKMDPWEKLSIDWDEMHPEARSILNDPLDWSEGYDYSPHGNDTGADIFISWDDYKNLSAHQAALYMGWNNNECDIENELFWRDWLRIHLALAFGHIKRSGKCNSDLACATCKIITEELRRISLIDWDKKEEYLNQMTRYSNIMKRFM